MKAVLLLGIVLTILLGRLPAAEPIAAFTPDARILFQGGFDLPGAVEEPCRGEQGWVKHRSSREGAASRLVSVRCGRVQAGSSCGIDVI